MLASDATLAQIERLQDEILDRLDELNRRLEALLRAETPAESGVASGPLSAGEAA